MAVYSRAFPQAVRDYLDKHPEVSLKDIVWNFDPMQDAVKIAVRKRAEEAEEKAYWTRVQEERIKDLLELLEGFKWNSGEEPVIKKSKKKVVVKEPEIDYDEVARIYREIHEEKKPDS